MSQQYFKTPCKNGHTIWIAPNYCDLCMLEKIAAALRQQLRVSGVLNSPISKADAEALALLEEYDRVHNKQP